MNETEKEKKNLSRLSHTQSHHFRTEQTLINVHARMWYCYTKCYLIFYTGSSRAQEYVE